MNKNYDQLAFCRDNYDNDEMFWADIAIFLKMLVKNDYEVQFYYEDCGIYVVNFNINQRHCQFGGPHLEWVEDDE